MHIPQKPCSLACHKMSARYCTAAVTASNHYPKTAPFCRYNYCHHPSPKRFLPISSLLPPPTRMAEELEDARFWLPSRFLDDDDDDPQADEDEQEEEEPTANLAKSSNRDGGQKKGVMAFSPPSTLYGMGSWSTSSREGSTEGSSTPPSPLGGDDLWDLLKLEENGGVSAADPRPERKPEKKQQQRKAWGVPATPAAQPLGLSSSAWPPLRGAAQTGPGSGMRAVFLQPKEQAGTGVFLPRNANAGTEPPAKPACSTVLLPAKVVQALNTNGRLSDRSGLDQNAIFIHNVTLLQKRGLLPRLMHPRQPAAEAGEETRLPSEWTY